MVGINIGTFIVTTPGYSSLWILTYITRFKVRIRTRLSVPPVVFTTKVERDCAGKVVINILPDKATVNIVALFSVEVICFVCMNLQANHIVLG